MFVLAVDVLDPGVGRVQLYLAAFIALVAIFFTILRTYLSEHGAKARRKVLVEMREYKEKARQEEARKRQDDMKKWEEGDDWPVITKTSDNEPEKAKDQKGDKKKKGGGDDGEK